jgi:hypothetical protein
LAATIRRRVVADEHEQRLAMMARAWLLAAWQGDASRVADHACYAGAGLACR